MGKKSSQIINLRFIYLLCSAIWYKLFVFRYAVGVLPCRKEIKMHSLSLSIHAFIGFMLENWLQLQDKHQCYLFAADWHALTTDYDDTIRPYGLMIVLALAALNVLSVIVLPVYLVIALAIQLSG